MENGDAQASLLSSLSMCQSVKREGRRKINGGNEGEGDRRQEERARRLENDWLKED